MHSYLLRAGKSFTSALSQAGRRQSQLVSGACTHSASLSTLAPGESIQEEVWVRGQPVCFEVGKLARLASGAAVVKMDNTHVMATAVSQFYLDEDSTSIPLQVEYRERLWAVGRIPNTFNRREGGPKEREVLIGRAIDRALRPLFHPGYFYETQVIHSVLCADGMQETDAACINAASAALMVSDIPWLGPLGCVRVAVIQGDCVLFPSLAQQEEAELNLLYAGTADKALMVEASGSSGGVPEKVFASSLRFAHEAAVQLIPPQLKLVERIGRPKRVMRLVEPSPELLEDVRSILTPLTSNILHSLTPLDKSERSRGLARSRKVAGDRVKEKYSSVFGAEPAKADLFTALNHVEGQMVRQQILAGSRCDGRGLKSVRPLYAEVGGTPIVHGSSIFSRGDTQAMATVTVGGMDDQQKLDSIVGQGSKRLMLHYSFPPYAVNECRKLGGDSRREIGHGALAENALLGVLPSEATFPFCVRVNSEITGSNGSSSMAAVCSGSLALMDAGIPMLEHVAGVSVGLVMHPPVEETSEETSNEPASRESSFPGTLLTDIMGLEDHHGDMDFKLAGTRQGITAAQLDIKPAGLPLEILIEALDCARDARLELLDLFSQTLASPRDATRANAPKFGSVTVEKDLLGKVIGPQGSNVKGIERTTGARITVNKSGLVNIFAPSQEAFDQTAALVTEAGVPEIRVGSRYLGKVMSLKDFGAIIEVVEGSALGLLHISEIAHGHTASVNDVLIVGQELEVQCMDGIQEGM
eukprot:CAMPEP_0196587260 /NCGR_PEP_ID=MMETSP1081-20130531/56948_1 /TAXON_ID=36882 /ORGANISM="Pyramimonas amylifera, Strain CCMP720" /LENGTH=755 /DNA_ID=CAMNT_0041909393 /DNA_START=110 /DNA_END=2378 /DNA_ORIENTATION=+